MSKDIGEIITLAQIYLVSRHPFVSILVMNTPIIESPSEKTKTYGTNGRDIFYNREYFKSLSIGEVAFCLSHCVYHMIFGHPFRRGGRDPEIWDMAIDYVTNAALISGKVGVAPAGSLYNSKYSHDMTAEAVYEDLIKSKTPTMPSLDDHNFGDGGGNSDIEMQLSDDELEAAFNDFRQIISSALAASPDSVDPHIRDLINDLNDPKIAWREFLDSFIRSSIKSGYTYKKMNKRSYGDIILPARGQSEKVKLAFCVDTSGSMGDEMLNDLKSEIVGFTEQFQDFEIDLWCFDTEVHNHQTFTPANIDDLINYEMEGGGGTTFACNWEYMKENDIQPDRLVMMTDGGDFDDHGYMYRDYCDVLFIVHSYPSHDYQPGHGTVCYYD